MFQILTNTALNTWSRWYPRLATILATTLILTACQTSTVPRPEAALQFSSDWANDASSGETIANLDHWWQAFGDPALNQLIEQGLAQNFDLQAAYSVVMEARAQIDRQSLRRRPVAEVSATVNQRRQSENGPLPISNIPGLDTDQTIHDVGAAMVWELDLFDRIANSIAAVESRFQASQFDAAAMASIISAEIADHYFNYRLLNTQQRSLNQQLELLRSYIALFEARQRVGDISNIPVSQLR
ncbi:MAG: TolC family protein, partial [Pseudomonadales bacterium]|nr:TolC family protein [Pseudomonadales bacterium]